MKTIALIMAVLLAGCASASSQPSPTPTEPSAAPSMTSDAPQAVDTTELRMGEKWVLVGGTVTPSSVPFRVSLRFDDVTIAGKAPVNRYSGQALVGEGTLALSALVSTKMAGPQDAMAAEQAYLAALGAVTRWEVTADQTLVLSDATGPVLTYAVPGSVAAFAVTTIGMPAKKAKAQIADAGFEARVVSVDGDVRPVTMDYRPDRINLTLVDGVVTDATVG